MALALKKLKKVYVVGWLAVLFYGGSTLFEFFNVELDFKQFSLVSVLFFCLQTVKYQNSYISNKSVKHKYSFQMSKKFSLVLFNP